MEIIDSLKFEDEAKLVMEKKREKFVVEIRKNKRDDILNRKRRILEEDNLQSTFDQANNNSQNEEEYLPLPFVDISHPQYQEMQMRMQNKLLTINYSTLSQNNHNELENQILNPSNPEELFISLRQLIILVKEDKIFRADLSLKLAEKLLSHIAHLEIYPVIVYESAQLLQIISGSKKEQIDIIVNQGGITYITNSFSKYSNYVQILNQLVEIMGNIAGEESSNRDLILRSGFLDLALQVPSGNISYLRTLTWTLTNICIIKEYCEYSDINQYLPFFLSVILNHQNDKQLLQDSFLSLSVLAKQAKRMDQTQEICSEDMRKCLLIGLEHKLSEVRSMALRATSQIAHKNKNKIYMKFFIENKLEIFLISEMTFPMSSSKDKKIQIEIEQFGTVCETPTSGKKSTKITRKYALQAIFYLVNDNLPLTNYLLENYSLIQILVNAVIKEYYDNNILESVCILESIFTLKKIYAIDSLLNEGLFDAFYRSLDYSLPNILQTCLELTLNILNELFEISNNGVIIDDSIKFPSNNLNSAIEKMYDSGLIKKILDLQGSDITKISELCMDILDKFFPDLE